VKFPCGFPPVDFEVILAQFLNLKKVVDILWTTPKSFKNSHKNKSENLKFQNYNLF
jgi:hypothetical protein